MLRKKKYLLTHCTFGKLAESLLKWNAFFNVQEILVVTKTISLLKTSTYKIKNTNYHNKTHSYTYTHTDIHTYIYANTHSETYIWLI